VSLSSRSIALAGVGFGARHVTLLGLVPIDGTPPVDRPARATGYSGRQAPVERRDVRRQNEAILLVLLH